MPDDDDHPAPPPRRRRPAAPPPRCSPPRRDGSDVPSLLVAAALLTDDTDDLARARPRAAGHARDRQLVALADAHLRRPADLLDALVRDHLADHPDHLLAAWIAGQPATSTH